MYCQCNNVILIIIFTVVLCYGYYTTILWKPILNFDCTHNCFKLLITFNGYSRL